jgi:hypothetical protein
MQIARIYTDRVGASHFDELAIDLTSMDFAPPAPPIAVSSPTKAAQMLYFEIPSGWYGAAHPAPRRQLYVGIAGTLEVTVSDGESRAFNAGDIVLLEDVDGAGHTTRVVSDGAARGLFIQLPI